MNATTLLGIANSSPSLTARGTEVCDPPAGVPSAPVQVTLIAWFGSNALLSGTTMVKVSLTSSGLSALSPLFSLIEGASSSSATPTVNTNGFERLVSSVAWRQSW